MTRIPHSPAVEEAFLGACLLDNEAMDTEGASGDLFFSVEHKGIWRAMEVIRELFGMVDTRLLFEHLGNSASIERCGGVAKVMGLAERASSASMAPGYVAHLLEVANKRELIEAAGMAKQEAEEGHVPSSVSGERLKSAIGRLSAPEPTLTPAQIVQEADRAISELLEGKADPIKTGIESIDAIMGGLREETVTVIAGRPAMGKTTMALQVALNIGRSGTPVLWLGLEMTRGQLSLKLLENLSRCPLFGGQEDVKKAVASGRVVEGMGRLSESHIHIHTGSRMLGDLIARTASWVKSRQREGHDRPVVMLDYLQRVRLERPSGQMHEDIGVISDAFLEDISKGLRVPVVLLSQLNRALEARKDKRPNAGDLKASGDIEQDAAAILMLYRPHVYDKGEDPEGLEVELIKNRFGDIGRAMCRFHGGISTVTSG